MTEETLPAARRRFANDVVHNLRSAGYEALWAGGCVRDLLLERTPTDYDVATSAHPEQVRQLFGYRRTLAVGAAFGVIIVVGPSPAAGQVEVATFRSDAQYSDGRRPDAVTFSTAEHDAQRRDFTINGMFYDPVEQRVIDYVGGEEDLKRGLIRAIGDADARIGEDKLRMLRAVRFAARFNFAIESATEAAISRHAPELSVVSGERMTAEMQKTLITTGRESAVRTWAMSGLMKVLLPQVAQHWQANEENSCALIRAVEPAPWTAVLAAMLWPTCVHDSTLLKSMLEDFKLRLKFSNDDLAQVKFAIEAQPLLQAARSQRWSQLQPWLIQPHVQVALALLQARAAIGEVDSDQLHEVLRCLALPTQELNPPPLIDGQTLQSLGLQPGPRFKELLSQARDAQLDGRLKTQLEAIDWVRAQSRP